MPVMRGVECIDRGGKGGREREKESENQKAPTTESVGVSS